MRATQGFLFLLLSLLFGNILSNLIPFEIPGTIWGMGVFLIALIFGIAKEERVASVCDFLLLHMNLFFLPGAANLILIYPDIQSEVLKILFVTIFSTVAVIAVTGMTTQFLAKRMEVKNV